MGTTTTIQTIECRWCGRHEDNVAVYGAAGMIEARGAAMAFFRNDENGCDDEGITLDGGRLITWSYDDEPQPADWQDHYVFRSVDAHPIDQREWWEK